MRRDGLRRRHRLRRLSVRRHALRFRRQLSEKPNLSNIFCRPNVEDGRQAVRR